MNIQPVNLKGQVVQLVPMTLAHIPDLAIAGRDESIWRYMRYGDIHNEKGIRAWVQDLLEAQKMGTDMPFTVFHLDTTQVVGATRYMNINHKDRAIEIGGTWYAVAFQRTAVNTECKYLLLKHAFETLGVIRVQFKTDLRNIRSQRALEHIGAVKEGVLRKHMILPDGYVRHSVFYSILDQEWPAVKAGLEMKLNQSPS